MVITLAHVPSLVCLLSNIVSVYPTHGLQILIILNLNGVWLLSIPRVRIHVASSTFRLCRSDEFGRFIGSKRNEYTNLAVNVDSADVHDSRL